ncbi:hypothetical protein HMPREF3190_00550 [Umbribacter vaginalis]|nr:hypothetical protein HMPREF3190_00550 [Coriobacteriales bacterium DNF00809]
MKIPIHTSNFTSLRRRSYTSCSEVHFCSKHAIYSRIAAIT